MTGIPIRIGIAGGRPGAGRRTVGINLAASLAAMGHRVGLADTERHGFTVPEPPESAGPYWQDGRLIPGDRFGVQVVSFSDLFQGDEYLESRWPPMADMAARFEALVAWDNVDLLFVELPSSGDDARLLLAQVPLDGVVLVATPKGASEGATETAVAFYTGIGARLVGIIENLSYYQCRQCGRRDAAEASGSVPALAQRLSIPYFGELPISIALRDCMDEKCPTAACTIGLPEAALFECVARNLLMALERCALTIPDHTHR